MPTRSNVTPIIPIALLCGALATVACGATTPDSRVSTPTASGPTQANPSDPWIVPAGQELDVRLQSTLSSDTATVEQRFEATTVVDLMQDGRVLVPAGSIVRGVVSGVEEAGRVDRAGRLTLSFDQVVVRGREHPMRATATRVFESGGIREEVGTVGAGAGVGGLIGGILGGVQGAVLGAVIGAGGVVAATEGADVELPAGSIVRLRIDTPIRVG